MRQTIQDRALVLRTAAVRDSDLIVTLLTPKLGKISAISLGARRSKKRFPGGIDLFDCAEVTLSEPRPNDSLYVLEALSGRSPWTHLRSNLLAFSAASLAAECALLLAPEGDHDAGRLFEPITALLSERSPACGHVVSFLVTMLERSGLHADENHAHLSPEVEKYLREREAGTGEVAFHQEQTRALKELLEYIEHLAGRRLNSSVSVLEQLAARGGTR